jgi:hypothetical protein
LSLGQVAMGVHMWTLFEIVQDQWVVGFH